MRGRAAHAEDRNVAKPSVSGTLRFEAGQPLPMFAAHRAARILFRMPDNL